MANTTNTNVINGGDLPGLLVSARQDAIFAGYESSIYLPGQIMTIHDVPAGSVTAQIPKFSAVATSSVETEAHNASTGAQISELDLVNVSNAGVDVTAQTYAARGLLKDLGGMNAANIGTVLGRAVSEKFDEDVATLFASAGSSAGSTSALTIDTLATAAQKVRANKFSGQLWAVLHPSQVEDILQDLAGADFAGSEAMNEAMRDGMVGRLFGMNILQSASVTDDSTDYTGCVWAENAFGIAMFKGLDVEFQRNSAAVGVDIVASLHSKAALVDANRACKIISAV